MIASVFYIKMMDEDLLFVIFFCVGDNGGKKQAGIGEKTRRRER